MRWQVTLQDARVVALADPSQLVGFCGTSVECPTHLLFARHGLHIIVVLDRATAVGTFALTYFVALYSARRPPPPLPPPRVHMTHPATEA